MGLSLSCKNSFTCSATFATSATPSESHDSKEIDSAEARGGTFLRRSSPVWKRRPMPDTACTAASFSGRCVTMLAVLPLPLPWSDVGGLAAAFAFFFLVARQHGAPLRQHPQLEQQWCRLDPTPCAICFG